MPARRWRSITSKRRRAAEAVAETIHSSRRQGDRRSAPTSPRPTAVKQMIADRRARAWADRHAGQQCRHRPRSARVDDLTEEDFDRTIAVNLKSVFLCTQAVLPGMRRAPVGPHRQHLLRRGARRGRRRPALQRLEGRHGRHDPRLRRAPGEGRHHGQRRGAVADRDRHGEAGRRVSRRRASRSAASARRRNAPQVVDDAGAATPT